MAGGGAAKGSNSNFGPIAEGQSASAILSASRQNAITGAIERLSQSTFGVGADALVTGPMIFHKGRSAAIDVGIAVQNNYPFRLPRFAVVGIDQPILRQSISDVDSLSEFLDTETIYSCTKNQARHRNRFGILQQALHPGEIGRAMITASTKAVFYFRESKTEGGVDVHANNIESTNSDYKHLGIVGAHWDSVDGVGGQGTEADYVPASDGWGIRDRPSWLFPIPESAAEAPYDELRIASSHGRASPLSGIAIPEISCTGESTAKCVDQRWQIIESTCSKMCSTWPIIESRGGAIAFSLDMPCVLDAEIASLPCVPELPSIVTFDANHPAPGDFASWGVWPTSFSHANTDAERFLVGDVMLGNPRQNDQRQGAGTTELFDEVVDTERDCYSGDGFTNLTEQLNACCANVTCTYECNGDYWFVARGESPWEIGTHRCICPDALIADRADFELPCGESTQPREFTIGMIYSTTTSTSQTTTSSTTTTTLTGACCLNSNIIAFGQGALCAGGDASETCIVTNELNCVGSHCATIEAFSVFGTYLGDNTTCNGVDCNSSTSTTATTDTTTTTESPTTTTTTDTTTTTESPTTTTDTTTTDTTTTTESPTTTTTTTTDTTTTTESPTTTTTTTTEETTTTTSAPTSTTTSTTTTTTAACGGSCFYQCQESVPTVFAWAVLENNCTNGFVCICGQPVGNCDSGTFGNQEFPACVEQAP